MDDGHEKKSPKNSESAEKDAGEKSSKDCRGQHGICFLLLKLWEMHLIEKVKLRKGKNREIPFCRYTNLAATIDMLSRKKIGLLNPAKWDDKNDAYFMSEYKRYKSAKTLLALCFAESEQTYHHWRVFSQGFDGVCIEFDKEKFLKSFEGDANVIHKGVEYKKINKAREILKERGVETLPFLKRWQYAPENEYRVVYVDLERVRKVREYKIQLDCINRITLSPWLPRELVDSVKGALHSIGECLEIEIYRSTVTENSSWKALTKLISS